MKKDKLNRPEYYINRELSWLAFNRRVLEEAEDETNPILERIKFISIVSSNLDEFFMVRVAGLKNQVAAGITKPCPAGLTPQEQIDLILEKAHKMVDEEYTCFKNILPLLKNSGITIQKIEELTVEQQNFLDDYYDKVVYPVLTPMAIDVSHPFPLLLSTSLNIIFTIEKPDKKRFQSIVQIPNVLPRLIRMPSPTSQYVLVDLGDVIKKYYDELYPGFNLIEAYVFRITRDSDLEIHEEESYDLLREIEMELRKRRRGAAVRLEIESTASEGIIDMLKRELDIEDKDIFKIDGPLALNDFMMLYNLVDKQELKYPPMPPQPLPGIPEDADILPYIKEKDILLHHPYHSFSYVINFIKNAARDPDVLAIKMTLYRVSKDSPIVKALIEAAEAGKQVTAIVELKARFDEERNIEWAKKLERAGVHVIYGIVGLKIHSKAALIIKREQDGIQRYVHMSTGNYNDVTARLYTDIGLMTIDEEFGTDISALFNVLTGFSEPPEWLKISVAPTGLRKKFIKLIQREAKRSTKDQPGRIIAKMNSLVDTEIIYNLYKASRAGVKIDLIVRGICCLRPGIARVSKNIRVISIVDRFLEHSRIYYFRNGGNEEIYLSSADWMPRNLDRRVELLFPVEDEEIKHSVKYVLDAALKDNVKARELQPDGTYVRVKRKKKKPFRSQEELYKAACESLLKDKKLRRKIFIPHRPSKAEKVALKSYSEKSSKK